jgi:hypothetical protein
VLVLECCSCKECWSTSAEYLRIVNVGHWQVLSVSVEVLVAQMLVLQVLVVFEC